MTSPTAPTVDLDAYRATVRAWLAEHAPRFGGAARQGLNLDQDLALGRRWMALKAEHGHAAIAWPQPWGAGRSEAEKLIFAEEEMKWSLPTEHFDVSLGMPVPMLLKHGTEAQKAALVPPAVRGETIWCQLFSEPGAGSDLGGVRLRAERSADGTRWTLNGQKIWTTMGHHSDHGVLVARNDATVLKHKGLTYFIIDMKTPGITVRPIRKLSGHATFCEVFFDDVQLPDSARLGGVGDGFRLALETLMIERYAVLDDACWGTPLSLLIDLAKDTPRNGRPAIEDAHVRAEIADMYCEQRGLSAIHAEALAAISAGKEPGPEGAIRKMLSALTRMRQGALALDLMGPAGVVLDRHALANQAFGMSWLDGPAFRVAGGTDEMLRNTVAERILGLPQDHRPDKAVPFNQI